MPAHRWWGAAGADAGLAAMMAGGVGPLGRSAHTPLMWGRGVPPPDWAGDDAQGRADGAATAPADVARTTCATIASYIARVTGRSPPTTS